MMLQISFGKNDSGIVLLENLTDPSRHGGPLHTLDKTKIIDPNIAKIVLRDLAKFHGIWLCWLKLQEPKEIAGLTNDSLHSRLSLVGSKSSLKDWLKVFGYVLKYSLTLIILK
jgi:hypothetical protein